MSNQKIVVRVCWLILLASKMLNARDALSIKIYYEYFFLFYTTIRSLRA